MSNHELLQAIRQIVSDVVTEEVGKQLSPMQASLTNVQASLTDLQARQETMQASLTDLQARQETMQARQETMQADLTSLTAKVNRIAITQETEVIPKLKLLYENQCQIIDEHKRIAAIEAKQQEHADRLFILEEVVKDLSAAK